MGAITSFGGQIYIHSEYRTTAKLNKLPPEVKEIILKGRETEKTETESETPNVEQ